MDTPVVEPPVRAASENTTVEIVYSDGACMIENETYTAMCGIGVWRGPNDPRC